jgi:hypothetical protein
MASGRITKHRARDGTLTWTVRADIIDHSTGQRRQPQKTFATRREAQAHLRRWLAELAAQAKADAALDKDEPLWHRPRSDALTIYFIGAELTHAIKIGRSLDVPARLRGLQSHCPDRLRLLGLRPEAGWRGREADLHRRFASLRMWGEWFRAEDSLLSYVRDHTLPPADYYRLLLGEQAEAYLQANRDVLLLDPDSA